MPNQMPDPSVPVPAPNADQQTVVPQQSVMAKRPRTGATRTILKLLAILTVAAVVIVLVVAYTNMFNNPKSKPRQEISTTASPSEQTAPVASVPAEAQIGTVVDLTIQPDGTVTLTIDGNPAGKKTYQLPSDQQVRLYTSATETTSIPIGQIQKGTIVNVIKLTNPDHYVIVGVSDKGLVGKLL